MRMSERKTKRLRLVFRDHAFKPRRIAVTLQRRLWFRRWNILKSDRV